MEAIIHITPTPIPPKPIRLIGRDIPLSAALDILSERSPRLILHGPDGTGKTTFAQWIMHDEAVEKRYSSRIFVSCTGVTSLHLLFHKLSRALLAPPIPRDSHKTDFVWETIRKQPRLLCLDNVESLWEDTSARKKVSTFLEKLHTIQDLALIVTMRGTKSPGSKVPWSRTLPPLTPLSLDKAIELFEDVSRRSADDPARKLVKTLACNPLAVTLVATLTKDESPAELLRHWRRSGAEIVAASGADREANLRAVISLSVNSRRTRENPFAKEVLALLGLLPDGLSSPILDGLLRLTPNTDIRKALDTLEYMGLVRKEESPGGITEYRVPPPVHRWTHANLHVSQELKESLYHTYIEFLIAEITDDESWDNRVRELANCENLLLRAFGEDFDHPALLSAAEWHGEMSKAVGNLSTEVVNEAVERANGPIKGRLLHLMGVTFHEASTRKRRRPISVH